MGSGVSTSNLYDDSSAYEYNEKTDVIGRGFSSTIYKAKLTETGRMAMDGTSKIPTIVAIKVVEKTLLSENEIQQAFEEARFLSKFRHNHAVKVYEFFQDENAIYIVMEYLFGGTLTNRIQTHGLMSEQEAALIVMQLASVVSALEASGVAHHDIRSENIVFVKSESTKIRLVDFGNLTQIKKDNRRKRPWIRRSSRYLAPETIGEGQHQYDSKVDVWAIGVVLYFILSGTFPYASNEALKEQKPSFLGQSHATPEKNDTDVVFHNAIWKIVSNDAKSLIAKLLKTNPDRRIDTVDILKDPWILQYTETDNASYYTTVCEPTEEYEAVIPEDRECSVTPGVSETPRDETVIIASN